MYVIDRGDPPQGPPFRPSCSLSCPLGKIHVRSGDRRHSEILARARVLQASRSGASGSTASASAIRSRRSFASNRSTPRSPGNVDVAAADRSARSWLPARRRIHLRDRFESHRPLATPSDVPPGAHIGARLSPRAEHQFPAALDDVMSAIATLLKQGLAPRAHPRSPGDSRRRRFSPSALMVAAPPTGACTAHHAAGAISPWVDLENYRRHDDDQGGGSIR